MHFVLACASRSVLLSLLTLLTWGEPRAGWKMRAGGSRDLAEKKCRLRRENCQKWVKSYGLR